MSSSISTTPSAPTANLSFFSSNLHHPLPPFTPSFSISFPMPNLSPTATLRLALCRAAKPQTGPPKKPPASKRKKKSKGGCSGSEALNLSDVEVVRELGVIGNDGDVVEYLGSDARSLPHQPMPLPKPPAGFVVDNHGRVVMASAAAKRIATIVDPMNNLPLECVVRRMFRSSKGDECMLLCPVDTPVQILKSTNMDGWSAVNDEEVESILPSAAYALAKIHMHLVYSGFCYTARGGFCYSEDNLFDFRTDNGQDADGSPTEGVEITCFHLDGAHYMIYTPSDPLLFVVVKNHNGVLQIADDDLLEDPAIISSIDEETEFNALVEEEAALLESLKLGEK
ncbi:hypothetical protein F2P56_021966 [Juglans regia]|uniref:Uncharacterized protein LOC108983392 n=2 Tax=Juglans regia TaxID=51240 RepID=A0A2I4DTS4_JUGRE|nr:uncharacterized protein LOC108983392 [Juglans regia]KAF5457892.1 hypothetical protein F2P56_021966 [Juglans regia]